MDKIPSSIDSERFILGSVLLGHGGVVWKTLKIDDLFLEKHKRIYQRMRDLDSRSEKLDRITLANELTVHGQLESIGGLTYICSLDDGLPQIINLDSYVRIVKEKSALRRLISESKKIELDSLQEISSLEIIEGTIRRLRSIENEAESLDEVPSLAKIIDTITPSEIMSPTARQAYRTGYKDLDKMIIGLEPGTLTVVGGRPSSGKSSLGMCVSINLVEHETPVAFFSLEMTTESLIDRMMCMKAKVSLTDFRSGEITISEQRDLHQALSDIYELPLYIDGRAMQTVNDITRKLERLVSKNGVRVVFVDYLQLMAQAMRGSYRRNTAELIGEIAEGLKAIAKEMNVAVVAMSQLSRASETRAGDHRPIMSDLRESGGIEQAADLILFTFREYQYKPDRVDLRDKAEVIIGKHRQGKTGIVKLGFRGAYTLFEDL